MNSRQFVEYFKKQLLADTALITRTQNHDFVALATQNRNISARFSQQLEKAAVEGPKIKKEFDEIATSFMQKTKDYSANSIIINEQFLKELFKK